jgi:NTP pyrophosphatase (non-canonical NTP hydrolase)
MNIVTEEQKNIILSALGELLLSYEMMCERFSEDENKEIATLYGLLGLSEEVGELSQYFKKQHLRQSGKLKVHKITEELGDILFYITFLSGLYNISLKTLMEINIKKIATRDYFPLVRKLEI